MMIKTNARRYAQTNPGASYVPMAAMAQQQFNMSLLVLALACVAFIMFNVFHFIVA